MAILEEAAAATSSSIMSNNTSTYIIVGVISIVVYFLFLKPLLASERQGQGPAAGQGQAANAQPAARTATARAAATATRPRTAAAAAPNTNINNTTDWLSSTRKPSHATKIDAVLVDGMLSFRHSTAASYEASLSAVAAADNNTDNNTDNKKSLLVMTNRKERAKILSRIVCLSPSTATAGTATAGTAGTPATPSAPPAPPPSRGTNVVVSIPSEDVGCPQLRRILYLLSTYFNVICVLSVSADATEDDIETLSIQLRGGGGGDSNDSNDSNEQQQNSLLPVAVLPAHRIVAAQSRMGRIALVRQLGRVEFVLDQDPEMKEELGRFGFQVYCYGDGNGSGSGNGNGSGKDGKDGNDTTTTAPGVSRLAAKLMD